ncbi:hypothetical protein BU17DRAFT_90723 [Hysterangium stoloniferum]|nr:hypothetical protein BU17DRAFT_90723 [Hysterangium stoloniferum]
MPPSSSSSLTSCLPTTTPPTLNEVVKLGVAYVDPVLYHMDNVKVMARAARDLIILGLARPMSVRSDKLDGCLYVKIRCSPNDIDLIKAMEKSSDAKLNRKRESRGMWVLILLSLPDATYAYFFRARIWQMTEYVSQLLQESENIVQRGLKRLTFDDTGDEMDRGATPPKKVKVPLPGSHFKERSTIPDNTISPGSSRSPLGSPHKHQDGTTPLESRDNPHSPVSFASQIEPPRPRRSNKGAICSCSNPESDPNHAFAHLQMECLDDSDLSGRRVKAYPGNMTFDPRPRKASDAYELIPDKGAPVLKPIDMAECYLIRSDAKSRRLLSFSQRTAAGLKTKLEKERERATTLKAALRKEKHRHENTRDELDASRANNAVLEKQIEAIREECREPFVVPSLLDAFFKMRGFIQDTTEE